MKTNSWLRVVVVIAVAVTGLYGCPKKADMSSSVEPQPQKAAVAPAPAPTAEEIARAEAQKVEATRAAAEAASKAEAARKKEMEKTTKAEAGLKPIYFDFDQSFIRDDARVVLQANAEYLKANPKITVRIEGNCDEKGTVEYNQALGQRRAASAKKYLTDMGIAAKRVVLLSYGKEKPVCSDQTEICSQKNRHDDFQIMQLPGNPGEVH